MCQKLKLHAQGDSARGGPNSSCTIICFCHEIDKFSKPKSKMSHWLFYYFYRNYFLSRKSNIDSYYVDCTGRHSANHNLIPDLHLCGSMCNDTDWSEISGWYFGKL